MQDMDWDDLRFFLAVARSGTLAGAARALAVDQTTAGRRVAMLEKRLGATLFARAPSGLTLSEPGRALLPHAEAVERTVDDFERVAAGEDQRPAGKVRLATSLAMANSFLIRQLGALHVRHPDIVVELTLGTPQVNLVRREADLAVRLGSRGQDGLLARKLCVLGWALYGSARYLAEHGRPRLGHGLAGHSIIGLDGDLKGSPGGRWLLQHASEARVALRCNDLVAAVRACEAGFGLALVPCLVTPDAAVERALPGTPLAVDAWLVMHRQVQKTARVRAVADFLVGVFADHGAALSGA
ncbi:MAG: LysR family transcriptional regulator [Polyangia bacterium]